MSFIEFLDYICFCFFIFCSVSVFIVSISVIVNFIKNRNDHKNKVQLPYDISLTDEEKALILKARRHGKGIFDLETRTSPKMMFSRVHNVKILPEYFEGVINGTKPFEFRKNDRGYKPGDCVCLKECIIDADGEQIQEIYTGQYCFVVIKDIFELGSIDPAFSEYVVFTFSILKIVEGENERQ